MKKLHIILSSIAFAQTTNADILGMFDYKGIPLNSEVAVVSAYSGIKCTEAKDKAFADQECVFNWKYAPGDSPFWTFGGAKVKGVLFYFYDNHLKNIGVFVPAEEFSNVVLSLKEKYGEPQAKKTETVQNRMGAKFENELLTWKKGASSLEATKISSDISVSSFIYQTDDYMDEVVRRRRAIASKRADDL